MKYIIERVKEQNRQNSFKWIAVDGDGKIWSFKHKPTFNEERNWWACAPSDSLAWHCGNIKLPENVHPKDTLREIE
jgi:hypothetical protein